MNEKDRLIVAQVAAKAAVELVSAGDQRQLGDIAARVQDVIYALAGAEPGGATDFAVAALPMHPSLQNVVPIVQPPAQVQQSPQAMVEQAFTTPAGQAPVNTAALPGAQAISPDSPPDVLWADALIHSPNDWWNNVGDEKSSSGGGKGPDFKHQKIKSGRFNLGLWIQSGDTPDWVKSKLGV